MFRKALEKLDECIILLRMSALRTARASLYSHVAAKEANRAHKSLSKVNKLIKENM